MNPLTVRLRTTEKEGLSIRTKLPRRKRAWR
jgi:hypothetical protein